MNTTRQTLTAGMTFTLGEQSALLQPTTVGAVSVANRLFMAPLTRSRADADGTPYLALLGQPVVVLEAMKMEHSIRAPHAGTVKALYCAEGDMVGEGAALVELEQS